VPVWEGTGKDSSCRSFMVKPSVFYVGVTRAAVDDVADGRKNRKKGKKEHRRPRKEAGGSPLSFRPSRVYRFPSTVAERRRSGGRRTGGKEGTATQGEERKKKSPVDCVSARAPSLISVSLDAARSVVEKKGKEKKKGRKGKGGGRKLELARSRRTQPPAEPLLP